MDFPATVEDASKPAQTVKGTAKRRTKDSYSSDRSISRLIKRWNSGKLAKKAKRTGDGYLSQLSDEEWSADDQIDRKASLYSTLEEEEAHIANARRARLEFRCRDENNLKKRYALKCRKERRADCVSRYFKVVGRSSSYREPQKTRSDANEGINQMIRGSTYTNFGPEHHYRLLATALSESEQEAEQPEKKEYFHDTTSSEQKESFLHYKFFLDPAKQNHETRITTVTEPNEHQLIPIIAVEPKASQRYSPLNAISKDYKETLVTDSSESLEIDQANESPSAVSAKRTKKAPSKLKGSNSSKQRSYKELLKTHREQEDKFRNEISEKTDFQRSCRRQFSRLASSLPFQSAEKEDLPLLNSVTFDTLAQSRRRVLHWETGKLDQSSKVPDWGAYEKNCEANFVSASGPCGLKGPNEEEKLTARDASQNDGEEDKEPFSTIWGFLDGHSSSTSPAPEYQGTTVNLKNKENKKSCCLFPAKDAKLLLPSLESSQYVPSVDIFVNSSKVRAYSLIFHPTHMYVDLLSVLPRFALPLYDTALIQYVCEDIALHSKFCGLEVPFRLLTHDIWFVAMYGYMADIPPWARPPLKLLRVYNYQNLSQTSDAESLHSQNLVNHNISTILKDYPNSIRRIELTYGRCFAVKGDPNKYFRNISGVLEVEGFKLQSISVLKYDEERDVRDASLQNGGAFDDEDNEDADGLFKIRQEFDEIYDNRDYKGQVTQDFFRSMSTLGSTLRANDVSPASTSTKDTEGDEEQLYFVKVVAYERPVPVEELATFSANSSLTESQAHQQNSDDAIAQSQSRFDGNVFFPLSILNSSGDTPESPETTSQHRGVLQLLDWDFSIL